MSEWISVSDKLDGFGFKLQLRLEAYKENAEIRLNLYGIEVVGVRRLSAFNNVS
jgi:hypothetical protein